MENIVCKTKVMTIVKKPFAICDWCMINIESVSHWRYNVEENWNFIKRNFLEIFRVALDVAEFFENQMIFNFKYFFELYSLSVNTR